MTNIDLSPLNPILEANAARGRTALLPVLHATQELLGYIPENAADSIAKTLNIPLSEVFGVIDFYALFYRQPVSKTIIHVCGDPACAMAGADSLLKVMNQKANLGIDSLDLKSITVERAPCLGLCEHAPALLVQGAAVARADKHTWEDLVSGNVPRPHTMIRRDIAILTSNCGKGKPTWLSAYQKNHGYEGLKKALSLSPKAVIDEIKESGLVGRGGAAFPTGLKWEGAANAQGDIKYVVCNGDEAEPGTFKDRVIMEDDPHRVIEGVLIAGYAIGAQKGYIYIRGEYTYPFEIMGIAVKEAKKAGLLGSDILGSGFDFDIEIRLGAGAYICGEETALFESIEGKRGFPRVKPPFPTTHGLFQKPTVINNVETLSNIPHILLAGAQGFRQVGTQKSPGPKLFCLSGDVISPGLYEVPFGVTFRHVLEDLAGGVRGGRRMKAALFGGAAGAFATEKDLDVRLTFEDLRSAGLPLGSGVITIFDETRDMADVLLRLTHFFADESCGKCYPCQIGTQRQHEIMQRAFDKRSLPGDIERLHDIGWTMTDASLCGLGQTAATAVLSALKLWPELFTQPTETENAEMEGNR